MVVKPKMGFGEQRAPFKYRTSLGSGHGLYVAFSRECATARSTRALLPPTLMPHVIVLPFTHFSAVINQNKHTALDNKAFIFSTNQTTH